MRITQKKQPFRSNFTLNGSVLEDVYEFRDLGLLTNHHLSWNSHVDAITNKANRILGLPRRTCRGWKDTETLKVLYCTLLRWQVEYGSVVWSPYTVRNIDKLERIQRREQNLFSEKRILPMTSAWNVLICFHLKRDAIFFVTFLYKALNGYLNVDVSPFLNFYSQDDPYRFRHVDDYSLKTNF